LTVSVEKKNSRGMGACPVCGEYTVSFWTKWWSTKFFAAKCQNCGEKLEVGGWIANLFVLFLSVFFVIIAIISFFKYSLVPLFFGLLIYAILDLLIVLFLPIRRKE